MQIGPTALFDGEPAGLKNKEEYQTFENFRYGADIRVDILSWLNVTTGAIITPVGGERTEYAVSIEVNALLSIFRILNITFGLGYELPFDITANGMEVNGKVVSKIGDVFVSPILYSHVGTVLNLGNIGFAVDYNLGLNSVLDMIKHERGKDWTDSLQKGRVSFSVLCRVF